MEDVFVSWSGGKDSCWAAYLAGRSALNVRWLVNMVNEDGSRSWIHALRPELVEMQSRAVCIPLLQGRSSMDTYEADFRSTMLSLKRNGVSGGAFGDIDLEENREWVSCQCQEVGITPHFALWGQSQEAVLRGFVAAGFEAVVVVAEANRLGEKWLGRTLDAALLAELSRLNETRGLQLAGESGEYHTLVVDGPFFEQRIQITESEAVFRKGYWFLDAIRAELRRRRWVPPATCR